MNYNEELLKFLNGSYTGFHAVNQVREILKKENYTELKEGESWNLEKSGKYFVVRNESSIMAFRIPSVDVNGFMIAASHSDSPTFKIKENPEIAQNGYVRLNVEGYGGMLQAPWFDRPLSVAGRVIVKSGSRFETKLVNVDEDFLMIPSLAIHMDRTVNDGHKYNIQKELLPVLGEETAAKDKFMATVAKYAGVQEEDILGHDLFLYIREKGTMWGVEKAYLSAPHLDDLQCGFGDLYGFLEAEESNSVPVLAIFDNEEVGSRTKQGADSTLLSDVLQRITASLNKEYYPMIASSFMVSADNAHALHPNHVEAADPVNRPKMNAGIVIKYNANQLYTTDAVSAAIFRSICKGADVPLQVFTNRSDSRGGSTLGNLANAHVSLNTVDIGLPQLAMHSCYETCGTKDTEYLVRAMKAFYSSALKDEGQGNYSIVEGK